MSERPTYNLTLQAARGMSDAEAIRALRWALKYLGRRHGLNCVRIEEVKTPPKGSGEINDCAPSN